MKFTVADVLDQLSTAEATPATKLEKALSAASKGEKHRLRIGLEALMRVGLLAEDEAGLRRLEDPELIEARLRCSSKGFCFALRVDGGEDIYIRDHQLNGAWNGDRVMVRITREGGRRRSPEGGVQCILERQTRRMLAQVDEQDERLMAVPLDDRLLTTVTLPATDASYLEGREDSVVEVEIDRYPVAQFGAEGHVVRRLPIQGGEEADLDLLLTKHGLGERPSAPRVTLKTPAAKTRLDLTALPSVVLESWAGKDAPALPALSLEEREGGWRLWVHAPSIAERIGLASPFDQWLREQGVAACVGSQWVPLLTPVLAKASSFTPGDSQPALSVGLELDEDGRLEHYRFALSEIRVSARVGSAQLAAVAERKPKARTVPAVLKPVKDLLPLLDQLIAVGALLRQQRLAGGSIDLDLPVPPIDSLGDLRIPAPDGLHQGWLVTLPPEDPMAILRESVIVAERALGRHLAILELPAVFAVHAAPESSDLNEVAKAGLALEIPLELSEDGDVSATELAAAFAGTDRSRALQQQLRDSLRPVQLEETAGPNAVAGEPRALAPWCLATLRYADLWNQHLLVSLLCEGKNRPTVRHKTAVDLASDSCHGAIDWSLLTPTQLAPFREGLAHGLVQRLNGRQRFLGELQADALAMAQARQAEPLVGQTLQGVISGVQSYGFFVEVPPSQVEGLVHVSSLKDDWYEYRARQNRLVGRKSRRTYMLGDPVEVEIQKVDALRHQIDLAVELPEGFEEAGEDTVSPTQEED